jgi:uncharacterized delta-60 repeat protein
MPAAAADINPIVNVSTEMANDLRGLSFAADGRIYASGYAGTEEAERQTVLARFNADGAPDTSFSEDGFVVIDLAPGRNEQSLGVAELSGGDVVVAVNAVDADGGQSVYLLRFNSAGVQRTAPEWGDAEGKLEVVFGWANTANAGFQGDAPPQDTAWQLLADQSGDAERLVVFGMGAAPEGSGRTDNDRYVVRLVAADGSPDPTFNGGSTFSYDTGLSVGDNARRGILDPDGGLLSAGYASLGDGLGAHIVLLRLTPDGALDPAFGNFIYPENSGPDAGITAQPGVAVLNPFRADGGFAECYGVARLSDGSYVTTGYGQATEEEVASTLGYATSMAQDVVTFRIDGNALSTAWGNDGTQAIQSEGRGQPTSEDRSREVVALADDRTLHVGRYGGNPAVYVVTPDGQVDTAQDGDGIIELGHPTINSQFFAAALSPDGMRVALTTNANNNGARLVVLEVRN